MRSLTRVLLLLVIAAISAISAHAQMQDFWAQNVASTGPIPGFTHLQNFGASTGTCTGTTCTMTIPTTTTGSFAALNIFTTNPSITITCVMEGSGSCVNTWALHHSSPNCSGNLSGFGSGDTATRDAMPAGTTQITFTISGAPGGFYAQNFHEGLPPSGHTASFDTCGSASSASCPQSSPCNLASLSLSATDYVVHFVAVNSNPFGWNACSAGYYVDPSFNCIGLNRPAGTDSPTQTQGGTGTQQMFDSGVAFKSNAGSFTAQTPNFSVVNLGPGLTSTTSATPSFSNCQTGCSVTGIPSTTAGNALVICAGNINTGGQYITNVTDAHGDTFAFGTTGSSGVNIVLSGQGSMSCAWTLNVGAAQTALTVTTSGGNNSTQFLVAELHRNTGSWSTPTQASVQRTAATVQNGVSFTTGGTNSLIFQLAWVPGAAWNGPNTADLYGSYVNGNEFFIGNVNLGIILNTTVGNTTQWQNPQNNAAAMSGLMFQ